MMQQMCNRNAWTPFTIVVTSPRQGKTLKCNKMIREAIIFHPFLPFEIAWLSLGTPTHVLEEKCYIHVFNHAGNTFHISAVEVLNEGCIIVSNVNGYQTAEIYSKITLSVPQSQGSVSGAQERSSGECSAWTEWSFLKYIGDHAEKCQKKSVVTNEGPVAADGWQSGLGWLWDIYEHSDSSSCNQHVNEPPRGAQIACF